MNHYPSNGQKAVLNSSLNSPLAFKILLHKQDTQQIGHTTSKLIILDLAKTLVISAQKNYFPLWAWPIMTPFLCKLGPIKQFLRCFTHFFFKTTGLQHKLLILIESLNICHWKSVKKSKVCVVFGAKFGPNLVKCCEKTKKLVFQWVFFIFWIRYSLQAPSSVHRNTCVKI